MGTSFRFFVFSLPFLVAFESFLQGEVGDCWFLGALAMTAQRQDDLLYPLFVSAHPEIGFFQIRFFLDGKWRVVSVDDFIPCKKFGGLIFAHCKDEDEYWVPLVEKGLTLNLCVL